MKMASIDVETTGLVGSQLLEVAIVVFDSVYKQDLKELPRLHFYVKSDVIQGDAYALQMNNGILRKLAGVDDTDVEIVHASEVDPLVLRFFHEHFDSRVTLAGKNIAMFDLTFFGSEVRNRVRHRVVDIGNLWWNGVDQIPDMQECLALAGIEKRVSHTALEDAWDNIELIWRRYNVKWRV